MNWRDRLSLILRNVLFMLVVPAAGAGYGPWWILRGTGGSQRPVAWLATVLIMLGVVLYLWCVWAFAFVGHGTPGPWDAPRHLVAVGPYRWVRNPIYIAALLVIGGEAWLFLSPQLLLYAAVGAIGVHVFVLTYEEPTLRRRFDEEYEAYQRAVPRWIPHPPREVTS